MEFQVDDCPPLQGMNTAFPLAATFQHGTEPPGASSQARLLHPGRPHPRAPKENLRSVLPAVAHASPGATERGGSRGFTVICSDPGVAEDAHLRRHRCAGHVLTQLPVARFSPPLPRWLESLTCHGTPARPTPRLSPLAHRAMSDLTGKTLCVCARVRVPIRTHVSEEAPGFHQGPEAPRGGHTGLSGPPYTCHPGASTPVNELLRPCT